MSMKITMMPGAYEGNCIECGKHFFRRQIDSFDDGAFCSKHYKEWQEKRKEYLKLVGERIDNRTTELLCKLLEERGLSCQTHYLHTSWYVGPKLYEAMDNLDGTLTVSSLTPEQVIAATLGGGKLTAEQVRKAIFNGSSYASYDGAKYYADGIGMQTIADELNAALWSGTCHITASSTDGLCSDNPRQYFKLSCGHSFTLDGLGAPVACPVCGKAVKR